ncbi:transglycosylase SLT domain-containing protein [Treponema sp. R80B11-R83G3]
METSFSKIKVKLLIPVFTGVLCSLVLCAIIADYSGYFKKPAPVTPIIEDEEDEEEEDFSALFGKSENIPDSILEYYRNPEYKEWVMDFFTAICSNAEIARAILNSCDEFDIPPALAFALCWEESRFNPNAINKKNRNGSVDRGLFQLNNKSFPHLDIMSFYDINTNARYGVGHLRYCMNSSVNEISALAMYNVGTGRVRSTGAPEVTLNYTSRILENRRKLETRFFSRLLKEEEKRLTEE